MRCAHYAARVWHTRKYSASTRRLSSALPLFVALAVICGAYGVARKQTVAWKVTTMLLRVNGSPVRLGRLSKGRKTGSVAAADGQPVSAG